MTDFLLALIGAALVSNLVLGLPLAADGLREARTRMLGPAGAAIILLAAPLGWLVDQLLRTLSLAHLYLFLFLPLLAALGWAIQAMVVRLRPSEAQPDLWSLLIGIGLGAMLLARSLEHLAAVLALGIGGGLGFWLVMQLFSDLLARLERCDVPARLRGVPMTLFAAGLMSLAFMGFSGLGVAWAR
ncbi:NADH:quinone oxidoreductase [Stutzerimonas urumqiensis]|uniref:Rnf-Nqr domain containing protein n=1 Tax=Stutzerimonas urumqiensis TaxID=638269 RepID=UPI003BAACAC2